jgi:splicing factor 3B subunit 3
MMIIIETDHNAYTEDTKQQRKIKMAEEMREAAGEDEQVGEGGDPYRVVDPH